MVAKTAPVDGTLMSWEEFDALGEIRAEYVDGRLVMAANPNRDRQDAAHALISLLNSAVQPGFRVTGAWSWKPGRDEFVPDILVYTETEDLVRYTGTPVLLVEILSSDRAADLVVKTTKYASYQVDRYWVLDIERRELYVFARHDSLYELELTIGEEPAEVDFGAGVARIDLAAIIPSA